MAEDEFATDTRTRPSKSVNAWHKLFTERLKEELRTRTHNLSRRLGEICEKMFLVSTSAGWQSWLLQVCEDKSTGQALGIPAYYTDERLSQVILGSGVKGLPHSHADALKMRVANALGLLEKVAFHALCSPTVARFRGSLSAVRRMVKEGSHEEPSFWVDINGRQLWKNLDVIYKIPGTAEQKWAAREYLKRFRKSVQDADLYALLLGIGEARASRKLFDKKDTKMLWNLKACLAELASDPACIETDLIAWWAISELCYEPFAEAPTRLTMKSSLTTGLESLVDRIAWSAHTARASGKTGAQRGARWDSGIEEYSEIKGMRTLLIAVPAMAIRASLDFGDHLSEYSKKSRQILSAGANYWIRFGFSKGEDGGPGVPKAGQDNGVGSDGHDGVWCDDQGLVAAVSTQLYALLEFWRWQTLYETAACLGGLRRDCGSRPPNPHPSGPPELRQFGTQANPKRSHGGKAFTQPVWCRIKDLPRRAEPTDDEKTHRLLESVRTGVQPMSGLEYSFMLLGPPGIGKNAIVEELWDFDQSDRVFRISVTPYDMCQGWLAPAGLRDATTKKSWRGFTGLGPHECAERASGRDWSDFIRTSVSSYFLVFVDEIHLSSTPSPFGLLLKPLQDGDHALRLYSREKNEAVDRALYVFASSRYRTKEEFIEDAARRNDIAMRDFATRVKSWVELPDLYTVPEQKYLIVTSRCLANFERELKRPNQTAEQKNSAEQIRELIRWYAAILSLHLGRDSSRSLRVELEGRGLWNSGERHKFESLKNKQDLLEEFSLDSFYPRWALVGVLGMRQELGLSPKPAASVINGSKKGG